MGQQFSKEPLGSEQYGNETDSYGRSLADRAVWRQATTLAAAGELTARWLEGHSRYQPGTLTPVFDEETVAIAATLAAINRAGLFTKESQPGQLQDAGNSQREYVTGFCAPDTASSLLQLSARTELVAVAHAPGEPGRASIPVTLQGDEVITVLGTSESPADTDALSDWSAESNETLALLLAESWYLELFDPVWGRSGRLLAKVLETLETPSAEVPQGAS